ncbi:hypothetical protein D9611_011304 [Ephemerocybe angulata]|uniref:Uncharacterized protein n=1 Tax=Ephemerocybe angulata TaxID=980116 RepID=A0A8H5F1N4_9AGAR|nr:hypothetical protein D9611_011304 [Tulosesus angulatus]
MGDNGMNLSHVISELSFGPYFPETVQPFDNSFEATDKNFVATTAPASSSNLRSTTFLQLLIRCVLLCTSYASRIAARAVEVVSGADRKL